MSESMIFKKRLIQLKDVLIKKRKIAENLFYKSFKLDEDPANKDIIVAILKKNGVKLKRGNFILDCEKGEEITIVRNFLKEALPFLLTGFKTDKSILHSDITVEDASENGNGGVSEDLSEDSPVPSALGLFSMKEGAGSEGLELEGTLPDNAGDGIERGLGDHPAAPATPATPEPVVVPEVPATPATPEPVVVPVDSPTIKEHAGVSVIPPPAILPRKPLTVTSSQSLQRKMSLEKKLNLQAATTSISRPVPSQPPAKPPSIVHEVPDFPVVPPESEIVPPSAPPVPSQPVPITPPPVPPVPEQPVPIASLKSTGDGQEAPPATEIEPIKYEYYVCSRCGEEISKFEAKREGSFLQCPKCLFQFAVGEAKVIIKTVNKASSTPATDVRGTSSISEEGLVKPSQLFGGGQGSGQGSGQEDDVTEALVKPSQLFGRSEEIPELTPPPATTAPTGAGSGSSQPPPSEHLVKPSEILKRKASEVNSAPAPIPATPGHVRQFIQKHEVKQPAGDALVKPSDLLNAHEDTSEPQCPNCGSNKYTKIQDNNKIISYNPLVYGYKKRCVICFYEFD
ncbi:MAG: hypothetical protein ACTSUE_01515 [Promethearchaeota archaeon]